MIFADGFSEMVMEIQEEQGDFLCGWRQGPLTANLKEWQRKGSPPSRWALQTRNDIPFLESEAFVNVISHFLQTVFFFDPAVYLWGQTHLGNFFKYVYKHTHLTHFLICKFDLKIDQEDKIPLGGSLVVHSDHPFLCLCFVCSINLRQGQRVPLDSLWAEFE